MTSQISCGNGIVVVCHADNEVVYKYSAIEAALEVFNSGKLFDGAFIKYVITNAPLERCHNVVVSFVPDDGGALNMSPIKVIGDGYKVYAVNWSVICKSVLIRGTYDMIPFYDELMDIAGGSEYYWAWKYSPEERRELGVDMIWSIERPLSKEYTRMKSIVSSSKLEHKHCSFRNDFVLGGKKYDVVLLSDGLVYKNREIIDNKQIVPDRAFAKGY